jgi:hypothetical protein
VFTPTPCFWWVLCCSSFLVFCFSLWILVVFVLCIVYLGIEADMTTHSPQCMVECVLLFVLVFCVVFLFCLSSSCLVYSMLPVSLDYPLLVVPKTNTNNTIRLQFSYKQHSRRTEHRTRE